MPWVRGDDGEVERAARRGREDKGREERCSSGSNAARAGAGGITVMRRDAWSWSGSAPAPEDCALADPAWPPGRRRRAFREARKVAVSYGVRAPGGAEFSASRRLYGGDVMAANPANAIHEIAGKLAIHNALLEAAGSA